MADARSILVMPGTANTPEIRGTTPALVANTARSGWFVQNLGTNALFVRLGTAASTTVFHFALKAGSVADDGSGGSISQTDGSVYTGIISIAGTSPRYVVMEI